MGEHAGRHPWWTPTRVLLLVTAFVFALGLVQKAPCSLADGKDQPWVYSHMCYSDLRPLYVPRGLAELSWPYSDDTETRHRYQVMEYPVGIAYWAYGAAWVSQKLNGSPDVSARSDRPVTDLYGDDSVDRELTIFVLVNATGFALMALLAAWALSRAHPGRPWDAAAFALSPALLLTGLINWDMIAVATVAGALWAWSRDRPVLTGVLIGLGTAVKLYPLFLLGGLLVICLRRRRLGAFAMAAIWAAISWSVVNLPAYLSGPDEWKVFWSFNESRGADLGSVWTIIDKTGSGVGSATINTWSWIVFGLWCVGVLVVGLLAGRRTGSVPRLAQLGFLIVAGFLLINKVYSPQYVLWLLPLAVMARPRWRDQIIWQAAEVFYFCTIWWYLGGYLQPAGGGEPGFYWVGIVVRMMGELYLVAMVVRDLFLPRHDPVRTGPEPTHRSGDHDPVERGGGVADPHVDHVTHGRHASAVR